MKLERSDGIRVEEIDGVAIVLDREGSVVHRATGDALELLRRAQAGAKPAEVPDHLRPAMAPSPRLA